jgi:hypothetical protein
MGGSDFRSSCLVPSPCFNCKNVFGLNILNKKHLCPACRRKITPYGEISTNPSQNSLAFEWEIDFETSLTYELARKIHKSKVKVNYWCTNKNMPSLITLSEIARVLEVKISDLIIE